MDIRKLIGMASVQAAKASGSALNFEHELLKAALFDEARGGRKAEAGERDGKFVTTNEPDGSLGVRLSGIVGRDFKADDYAEALNEDPNRAVTLYINSPGGLSHEGMAIGNLTGRHPGGVKAVVDGLAGSAATIPAIRASSLEFSEGSEFLVHEAHVSFMCASVTAAEWNQKIGPSLEATNRQMAEGYAKATGKTVDEVRALMVQDRIMAADEAVEFGFGRMVESGEPAQAALDMGDLPSRIRPIQAETPERVKAMGRYLSIFQRQTNEV